MKLQHDFCRGRAHIPQWTASSHGYIDNIKHSEHIFGVCWPDRDPNTTTFPHFPQAWVWPRFQCKTEALIERGAVMTTWSLWRCSLWSAHTAQASVPQPVLSHSVSLDGLEHVAVTFPWLWQNTWGKQRKGGRACFDPQFQSMVSWLHHCEPEARLKPHGSQEADDRQEVWIGTFFLPAPGPLPYDPFSSASINGLTHWWEGHLPTAHSWGPGL
jgi:hypothetical protein